jgi:hypothetical protein
VNDERAAEAVDHLQAAALELIEAARAFLDVAEELVSDRDRLSDLADTVGEMAVAAGRLVRPVAGTGPGGTPGADDPGAPRHPTSGRPTPPVERIPVS